MKKRLIFLNNFLEARRKIFQIMKKYFFYQGKHEDALDFFCYLFNRLDEEVSFFLHLSKNRHITYFKFQSL